MKQLLYLGLLLFFCYTITTFSQNPEWINYTSGNVVNEVEIEGDFIWVGTTGGLVKLDRISGETIFFNTINSELPDKNIRIIEIDNAHNKWICTDGGLVKYDDTTWTFYNENNSGLPRNYIFCMAIDSIGNKWIGTWDGLVKYDDTTWTVYNENNSGLPGNVISAISIDDNGNKWLGTTNGSISTGLVKYDDTEWIVYNDLNSGLPNNHIECITIDKAGNKWIGTGWYEEGNAGLAKFDDTNWTVYNKANSGLPDNSINCIVIDKFSNKWIGTGASGSYYEGKGGLAKFNDTSWEVYNSSNSGLVTDMINCLAIDESGVKWIGTLSSGLIKFNDLSWEKINTSSSGLPSNDIECVTVDAAGNKWIGTSEGLAIFDGSNWVVYDTLNSGLPSNGIRDIVIDKSDNKWIVTGGHFWGHLYPESLAKFDGTNWTIFDSNNSILSDSENVFCIIEDKNGVKWFGTNNGLIKYDDFEWTRYTESNSGLANNIIIGIVIDDSNNKWILHPHWSQKYILSKFDDQEWVNYPDTLSHSDSYWCLTVDKENKKWIGLNGDGWGPTELGLLSFDDNIWTSYSKNNSTIPSEKVTSIVVDEFNNKWIGTFQGLAKFDGAEEWTVYNESNSNLVSNWITCITIDESGNKWIGTHAGLSVFNEGGVVTSIKNNIVLKTIPKNYVLYQNYPNPFNPATKIQYSIPLAALSSVEVQHVTLKVYDILGREVTTLVNQKQKPGNYEVTWDASNQPSGVYFYQLTACNFTKTKKMILLR